MQIGSATLADQPPCLLKRGVVGEQVHAALTSVAARPADRLVQGVHHGAGNTGDLQPQRRVLGPRPGGDHQPDTTAAPQAAQPDLVALPLGLDRGHWQGPAALPASVATGAGLAEQATTGATARAVPADRA